MTGVRIERRALLSAALLAGVGGVTGCGIRSGGGAGLLPADGTKGSPSPSGSPTPADWKALAESLAGKLLRPGDAGFNVAHQLFDPAYDGTEPAAVAECARPADAAETLKFAERYNLPVVGRSGGHSYVGASTTHGGIVIDVRPIKTIAFEADNVARVGGGALLKDVYGSLAAKGRVIPAGSCPSVGVAGLSLGGGFGLGNRAFGLTCDTITQVQVVTADGQIRTANANKEPELYWACRGGGGGTLGVVTAFWFQTVASPLIGTFRAQWTWSEAAKVIRGWQKFVQSSTDEVWADMLLVATSAGNQSVSVFGVDVANDPAPQLAKVVAAVGVEPVTQSFTKNAHLGPSGDDQRTVFYAGTDVLGQPVAESGIPGIIAAMNKAAASKLAATAIWDSLGGAISRYSVGATAFPWRKSFSSIQWYSERGHATPRAARDWIAAGHKAVANWAVGGYVNYLEPTRTNGSLYFGPNTQHLKNVKLQYDPKDVFKLPYTL